MDQPPRYFRMPRASRNGPASPKYSSRGTNPGRIGVASKWPRRRAIGILSGKFEFEQRVERERVFDEADHLHKLRNPAHAVAHALGVHHEIDRAGDLAADGFPGHVSGAHQDHVFDAGERVARGIGVHGGHRSIMAGVHRLQHVEGFRAADLAYDDPVRTHPQRVAHERALIDLPAPLDIRRPGFKRDYMVLLQLEFGRVLDGDDALGRDRSCARAR